MKQNFVLALSSFYVKENLPVLLNLLRDLLPGSSIPLSYELLLNINEENSDFIVSWFRYITSTQIRQQEGYYSSIISAYDCGSVQEFCAKTVEPMGIDCEQLQIMAFAEAMGVQIRIIYVDGYNANSLPNHEDYPSTGAGTSSSAAASSSVDDFHSDEPQVALVFINGHYDIIYRC
ncbi:Ubiquitin thioesterase otubain-like [Apostasia shenzhenica]|uniref:Ubiquitin thioesterase otubain-like n=1 Tax=Apostasia shenzhenica TaxID=1088818 RepID=A0A2I0AMT9_9ASPA|nr:Ubiquitin thioesterase otubain-like [Apostasia shenzhenica]